MSAFHELFPLGEDDTPYRKLTGDYVATARVRRRARRQGRARGADPAGAPGLRRLPASAAPRAIWRNCAAILDDPEASANDRFVAFDLLKNANIAAGKVLPMCQDTGTAIVMGKKGQQVWTGGDDAAALVRRHPPHLHRDQSALQPGRAAVDVRGGQYRRQSAGADRPLRRAGRRSTNSSSSPRAAARPTRAFSTSRPRRC